MLLTGTSFIYLVIYIYIYIHIYILESSGGLDSFGSHSGQGSIIPVVAQEMRFRKQMGGCAARIYAQNFDAVLVVIVISAGDAIFAKFYQKCKKHTKLHTL